MPHFRRHRDGDRDQIRDADHQQQKAPTREGKAIRYLAQ
jgi:hypothetical protein